MRPPHIAVGSILLSGVPERLWRSAGGPVLVSENTQARLGKPENHKMYFGDRRGTMLPPKKGGTKSREGRPSRKKAVGGLGTSYANATGMRQVRSLGSEGAGKSGRKLSPLAPGLAPKTTPTNPTTKHQQTPHNNIQKKCRLLAQQLKRGYVDFGVCHRGLKPRPNRLVSVPDRNLGSHCPRTFGSQARPTSTGPSPRKRNAAMEVAFRQAQEPGTSGRYASASKSKRRDLAGAMEPWLSSGTLIAVGRCSRAGQDKLPSDVGRRKTSRSQSRLITRRVLPSPRRPSGSGSGTCGTDGKMLRLRLKAKSRSPASATLDRSTRRTQLDRPRRRSLRWNLGNGTEAKVSRKRGGASAKDPTARCPILPG